jgi:RHS repeat-associated protein
LLDELAYPASPVPTGSSGTRVRVHHAYESGWPSAILDVTEPAAPRTLWSRLQSDDMHRPVEEALANGAVRVRSAYDAATGALLSRESATGAGPYHQQLALDWDAAGQLAARRDLARGLGETYTHDALGRLTGSSLNGTPNLALRYDAAGNVLHKSDVGDYAYRDAARPHAVTAAGGDTYSYDANGNVAARNGLPQHWASYNLPTLLQQDGHSSAFAYGPDRERWRQVATYANGIETTHYAGRLLEKESTTSTGLTYWRHYVPTPGGATVVLSRDSSRAATTTYVLPDALGSSDVLLDDAGAPRARLAYAAFGARRGAAWSETTAPDWAAIANSTRQGYTGHEMLDNLGLVHMQGRVYDPRLGRFLSADPVAGDLTDAQSLNPYAYVGNRPYAAVDPSGFAAYVPDGVCGGVCATVVVSVLRTFFGAFGESAPPPPPATALPGQSAQGGAGLCGPGTFSPLCSGHVLYAGVPARPGRGPGSSTWGAVEPDPDAEERLQEFFRDLGRNTVTVLVLEPFGSLRDAWHAAGEGDYLDAALGAGGAACDIAKPCKGVEGSFRAVQRVAGSARRLVPDELARVVAGRRQLTTLGRPDAPDVFVVDAEDIAGLDARQLARRLTIPESDTFTVIRFPAPSTGVASPVFRSDPGFIPGGLTRGGAREYVIPNGPLPPGARIEVVGP